MWVVLLEKAYAKIYGNYQKIEAGITGEAIRNLTGAPAEYLLAPFTSDEAWNFLYYNNSFDYVLTAGSNQSAKGDREKSDKGIAQSHAYSILNVEKVQSNGKQVRLLQLRNPWGTGEWTGDWSDASPLWTP
jgi:calpain-15